MLVKITKEHYRALDPRTVEKFELGSVKELDNDLAQDIIKNGFGIEHKEFKTNIENKAIFEAPENKEELNKKNIEQESKEISKEEEKKESEEKSKKKTKK